ncbi:uncharacterized protein LOC117140620 [Drosophila mauritiana]|uniref:Uncharacterized protein LOC117140620 n=1 Tax=Drosophila mauritiana TaxID=7226 RepID=A0A6P8JTH7_DROMA|nr:uncharacterized protein LOC117140620 [Drosophila mauritiana]
MASIGTTAPARATSSIFFMASHGHRHPQFPRTPHAKSRGAFAFVSHSRHLKDICLSFYAVFGTVFAPTSYNALRDNVIHINRLGLKKLIVNMFSKCRAIVVECAVLIEM